LAANKSNILITTGILVNECYFLNIVVILDTVQRCMV